MSIRHLKVHFSSDLVVSRAFFAGAQCPAVVVDKFNLIHDVCGLHGRFSGWTIARPSKIQF
jgi:hypothetical protein